MTSIFISYSHKDAELEKELIAALAALKREGVIDVWHDREISPGEEIDREIDEHIESADIILFLVSNYFVASDYVYSIEVERAMERHKENEARVIPVILRPTDWHSLPFGKLLALPQDGKPVNSYKDTHEAFLQISQGIRRVINGKNNLEEKNKERSEFDDTTKNKPTAEMHSSDNLQVKRNFGDNERDKFLDDTFNHAEAFFENSLSELERRNQGIETRFRKIDAQRFAATIYQNGKSVAQCTIWRTDRSTFSDGIAYSEGERNMSSGFNELISVDDDGYALFLKPTMMAFHGGDIENKMTQRSASEYLWRIFIERLQ